MRFPKLSFLLAILILFACSEKSFVPKNEIVKKSFQNVNCDTLKSFGDKNSWCYLIKCDSCLIRFIYNSDGISDITQMMEEGKSFVQEWFNKGRLCQTQTFDSIQNHLYTVYFDSIGNVKDTLWQIKRNNKK